MIILEMMRILEACGDITVWERTTNKGLAYDVTVEDFEGFDDNWNEVEREYEMPDLVDEFLDELEAQAIYAEGDFYRTYFFDNFSIELGFGSYDI